eukprot:gene8214-2834_t
MASRQGGTGRPAKRGNSLTKQSSTTLTRVPSSKVKPLSSNNLTTSKSAKVKPQAQAQAQAQAPLTPSKSGTTMGAVRYGIRGSGPYGNRQSERQLKVDKHNLRSAKI